MTTEMAEIVAYFVERKNKRSVQMNRAVDIKQQYNGEVVIPLPELEESERPAVANLLVSGIDQTAMRIGSTLPDPMYPPTRPGIQKQEDLARDRRRANLGWWQMNRINLKIRKRSRYFVAYASAPSLIRPDFERRIPTYQPYDPLTSYPSDCDSGGDDLTPDDCIFTYLRSLKWLTRHYPEAAQRIKARAMSTTGTNYGRPKEPSADQMYQLIEFHDAEESALGVMGKATSSSGTVDAADAYELRRTVNLAQICPVVVPGRVTLDRPQGQFDSLVGMFQQQAKLQALAVHATERGIFADEWIVARPNETPEIVQMADGRRGVYGRIEGGELVKIQVDPSYMTNPMIDRLEQAQRSEGGIPAQYSGLAPSTLRTGRANSDVMSAAIDMTIQEAQEVFAASLEEENKRAIAIDKAYWHRPKSFYVSWRGETSRVDYSPKELWTTDNHTVGYAMAGVDVAQQTVVIGQMLGTKLTSERRARRMHPLVDDPDSVEEEVTAEALNNALLESLQQQYSQPGANVAEVARITQLVTSKNMPLAQAVVQVHEEAQKRQAAMDTQGNDASVQPGMPGAMPGLAGPGQGEEAGVAAIPPQSPDSQNLLSLLRGMSAVKHASAPPPQGQVA